MRTKTLVTAAVVILSLAVLLAACGGGGGGGGGGPATLTAIEVMPINPSVALGAVYQFKATGRYSDGGRQDMTASATWSSSDETKATFSTAGPVTLKAAGPTTITAISGTVSGDTVLTVRSAVNAVNLPQSGQSSSFSPGDDGDLKRGVAPTPPDSRFTVTYCNSSGPCTDQGSDCDGNAATDIVKDNLSGLIWARDGNPAAVTKPWTDALAFANGLTLCGFTDWRLPNRKELKSLVDFAQMNNADWLNSQGFNNVQASVYWASTSHVGSNASTPTRFAWYVSLRDGSMYINAKTVNLWVWAVRSGQ